MEEDLSLTLSQPTIDLTLIPSSSSSSHQSPPSNSQTLTLTPLRSPSLARDLSLALVQERPRRRLTEDNLNWILSVMPACAQRLLFDDELGLMGIISDPSAPEALLTPDLTLKLSITLPPLPSDLAFLPTLPFPLYHPNIPFPTIFLPELLLRGPYLFLLQANLLAIRYIHSQTFKFFLLLNLYLTQQSPFRLLSHSSYPSDVLMEDVFSDSDSDIVIISPVRSLTPPTDSFQSEPFPLGPPVPDHFPHTSGPSYPNVESALMDMHETTLATMRSILQRQEELSDQLNRSELRVNLELETLRLGQQETNQRLLSAVDLMMSSTRHWVNNAVAKAVRAQQGRSPSENVMQQLAKAETLRAEAAVAEEVAIKAMEEEKFTAAAIRSVIRQNDYFRAYLNGLPAESRPELPSRPSPIEAEGLQLLKDRQTKLAKKKLRKLKRKSNFKKSIAEISSESSEDEPVHDSDDDFFIEEEYRLNFNKLIREMKKKLPIEQQGYLMDKGTTSRLNDSDDDEAPKDKPEDVSDPSDPKGKGKRKLDD